MCDYNKIEKEIEGIKKYIEAIVISDYKNCILFQKLDIVSNLYFLYKNMSSYINEVISQNTGEIVTDNILNLIDDIRFKVMVLKTTLLNIEKKQNKTNEKITFKEYINKNIELMELCITQKGLKNCNIEALIKH